MVRLENYSGALSAFRRAIDLTQRIGNLNRAAEAALIVFQEMGERLAIVERAGLITGRKLREEIKLLEHDLIKHSLEVSKGSVTPAADNLGISYQELTYMLDTRHKDPLSLRTPVRRRPRQK